MGAWGVEIFEDDTACDIRGAVDELLAEGRSIREATDVVLTRFSTFIQDEEDGPIVFFALAAAQCEAGHLDPRVKKKALELIDDGVDPRWKHRCRYRSKRADVLRMLASKLQKCPI
jgi:hypothetical protein